MSLKVYSKNDEVTPQEKQWFSQYGFPNIVSKSIIQELGLLDKEVLDVGCGSDANLGCDLFDMGIGSYIPLDIRRDAIKTMCENLIRSGYKSTPGIIADIMNFCPSQQFDIVHQRFVLMHYQGDKCALVSKLLSMAKEAVVLVEYDWKSLEGQNNALLNDFIAIVHSVFLAFGSDPYIGQKLPFLVGGQTYKTKYRRHNQKEKYGLSHSDELVRLGELIAAEVQKKALKYYPQLMVVINQMKDKPFNYEPIDLCSLTIYQ